MTGIFKKAAYVIGGVTVAAGVYYTWAQRGSPENAHPDTLLRDYFSGAIATSLDVCQKTIESTDEQHACALALAQATSMTYIHWRNSMTQQLYNSVLGTVIGNSVIGFEATILDQACYETAKGMVAEGNTDREADRAALSFAKACIPAIKAGVSKIQATHEIRPADLRALKEAAISLENSLH